MRELIPSTPHFGNTEHWAGYATDELVWNRMVKSLGKETYAKYAPNVNDRNKRRNTRHRSPPSPQPNQRNHAPPPSPPPNQSNNDKNTRRKALLQLDLPPNASRREVIMQFRTLSRQFHPDKCNASKPFSKEEEIEKFKIIANAREFLLEQ